VVTCAPNCPDGVLYEGYRNRLRRQVEWVDGVRVVRVWSYLAANAGTMRRILNYLSYLVSAVLASIRLPRPDVVVATSPQFFCGWAGTLVSRLKRVPFVLEIRDIWPESIQAVGALKNGPLLGLLERMERWLYRSARQVVAVGEGYRAKILEKLPRPDRVSVITNGVDPRVFVPDEPYPRLLHIWNLEDKFICSYVGTIGMAHGLEVVLDAAKILKQKGRTDVAFCLVGDGAARQRLQARAEREGLTDMVVFTGRQPKEEIAPILASSNACLIHLKKCSLFETVLPSKLFEVMAMARPVIMGVRGEALEIVRAADAGLEMDPGSATALVEAVETLAENPIIAARMGQSGRDYVEEHFDRDELARRYLCLLADVAGVGIVEIRVVEPVAAEQVVDHAEMPENAAR
jgi:glycosyltransferase involved in cell wall biosynthesis